MTTTPDYESNPFIRLVMGLPGTPESDAPRRAKMRECYQRDRRFMAEESVIWTTMSVDEQLERFPSLRQRQGCATAGSFHPAPVCTFPECGAPATLGIPLDAETRARYKVSRMEHDPE